MNQPALHFLAQSPHELVVSKPAGMASESPNEADASVQAIIARQFPGAQPKLPHRLDRVTRGILLVCLTQEAIVFQNAEIAARHWEKYYLARVAAEPGVSPTSLVGEHKAFLSETGGRARVVHAGGKPSRMQILCVADVPGSPDRFHVLIRLLTGRFHQIRVMCAALGLPLAGDPLYDPKERDPDEFYLEHILLKYTPFHTRERATIFRPDDAQRGAIAAPIAERLAAIASELT